jgi:hypothetical protein
VAASSSSSLTLGAPLTAGATSTSPWTRLGRVSAASIATAQPAELPTSHAALVHRSGWHNRRGALPPNRKRRARALSFRTSSSPPQ